MNTDSLKIKGDIKKPGNPSVTKTEVYEFKSHCLQYIFDIFFNLSLKKPVQNQW